MFGFGEDKELKEITRDVIVWTRLPHRIDAGTCFVGDLGDDIAFKYIKDYRLVDKDGFTHIYDGKELRGKVRKSEVKAIKITEMGKHV